MTCLAVTVTLTPVSPPLLPSLMTNNKQVAPNISVPLWLQNGFDSEWTETPRPHPPQQMDGIFPSSSQSRMTMEMKECHQDLRNPQTGQSEVAEDQFRVSVPLNTSMVDTPLFRNV